LTQPEVPNAAPPASGDSGTAGAAADGGGIRVKLFARTDVGQIREHNEDNFLVADLTKKARGLVEQNRSVGLHGALFAVCDGMGGAAAGEIASQLAVDILYERMVDGLKDAQPLTRDELARRLVRAIEAAGLRIFQEAKVDRTRRGMGTTVTAAALVDDHLFFAQVGDSRGYVLRQGQLVQLTRDQSLVNQLIEAGQLTEEEAETFEHNNIILQALGTADTVQVDLTFCELRRGDALLLCSDGLSGMVRFDDVREALRSTPEPLEACKLLIERANQAGGHDNITVIVAQFDGEALQPLGENPEPLKYRKYVLPEEQPENTEPSRRLASEGASTPAPMPFTAGTAMPQGLGSTMVAGAAGMSGPPGAGAGVPDYRSAALGVPGIPGANAPAFRFEEEQIEIPGTHVPPWVVVVLVVGVVSVLVGTAFVFLR
jgi:serine/threonine protein phosphatase PrpC